MPLDLLRISVALAALALTSSTALAAGHDIGPHSRSQMATLCTQERGQFTSGPAKWGCVARVWTIACVQSGKHCVIDLFGVPSDGSGKPQIIVAATTSGDVGGANGAPGGNPGGVGNISVDKVDTSGLKSGLPGDPGSGGGITTTGPHHGTGVQLH